MPYTAPFLDDAGWCVMAKRGGFRRWLAALTLLVLAGVAVPYGVLAGRQDWSVTGFWVAFALAVVAVILRGIRGWRDV